MGKNITDYEREKKCYFFHDVRGAPSSEVRKTITGNPNFVLAMWWLTIVVS